MRILKIFVAVIVLGMLLAALYCSLRVYSSPIADLNIQALAIGLVISIIIGGAGMLKSLFLVDRTALRMQIREGFDSEEMGATMERLGDFGRECGNDYHQIKKKFGEMLKNLPKEVILEEQFTEEQRTVKQLNSDRRKYSHYFYGINSLLDEVFSSFIKKVVSVAEIKLLLEVVEPIDEVKNPDYNKKMFDKFRKMYEKELKEK